MARLAANTVMEICSKIRYGLSCIGSIVFPFCSQTSVTDDLKQCEDTKYKQRAHGLAKMNETLCTPSSLNQTRNGALNGIDNCSFSMSDEGFIDCLTDDALLTVFSFLSLVDRGRVARVCKRWNEVMRDSRLWTCINFWQTCDSTPCSPWTDEKNALRLLQTYANGGLRSIHLKVIGTDVLLFLRQHCPNVEVFSFWPPTWPPRLALDSKLRPVPYFAKNLNDDLTDSLQISNRVVKVQLTFMGVEAPKGGSFFDFQCGGFTHALLCRLSRCRHLRHLSLAHCDGLDVKGIAKLSESLPDLEELWLMNFKLDESSKQDDPSEAILDCIANNLTNLTSFRFITAKLEADFDAFMSTVSKRGKLKQLWLGRGPYCFSEEVFLNFCQNLPGLEELVLESCICVTDEIIKCIGQHLKKLKILNLLGSGFYTVESVSYLHKHPTLQYTNVPNVQLLK
ncbi:uncharacterized protein [Amphiura filiformis]|uniref:uncharacterized protein n=1 Tax=Amphiura filiformis TaxID=82378 RepID=UPI003B227B57